jgi:hypothetical protein
MKPQVVELNGDQIPDVWRPAWERCWAVMLNGELVAGPFATAGEAESAASGDTPPPVTPSLR